MALVGRAPTRRAAGRSVAALAAGCGVVGAALGGCRLEWPRLPSGTPRVVRLAVFQSPYTTVVEPAIVAAQQAAAAVSAERQGYEVLVDQYPYARMPSPLPPDYAPSAPGLEQANASGTPPDVVLLTLALDLAALVKRRLVSPLEDVRRLDRAKLEGYASGALEAATTRGTLAALPLAGAVNLLFHDVALFGQVAVAPPRPRGGWSWNDFLEACRRLTHDAGPGGRPQWGTVAHDDGGLLQSLIWAHGGDVVARNGRSAALGEAGARRGIQFWLDLMVGHRVAPLPAPGEPLHRHYGPTEMWLAPQQLPGSLVGTSVGGSGTPRVAMAVLGSSSLRPIIRAGTAHGPRTMQVATLPASVGGTAGAVAGGAGTAGGGGAQRAAQLALLGALALGAKLRDRDTGLRAAFALAERLHPLPVEYGFPVRHVETALVRRVYPEASEQDAEVIARATAESRGVSLDVNQAVSATLSSRVMPALLSRRSSIDDAIEEASAFLEASLGA